MSNTSYKLAGKVAVVTGGSKGIVPIDQVGLCSHDGVDVLID